MTENEKKIRTLQSWIRQINRIRLNINMVTSKDPDKVIRQRRKLQDICEEYRAEIVKLSQDT